MNPKRYLYTSILVLAVSLLAACNNSYGVFSTIQEESKNSNTSTFYQTLVPDLVAYDGNYYARLVGIYSRPASSAAASDWSYIGASTFGSDYVCKGMTATGTDLYVAISNGRGKASTPNGIYRLNGTTWTHPYTDAENIQALYSANNEVFAVTLNSGGGYSLWHFDGTSLDTPAIFTTATMPTNVVYFKGSYYCASGTSLYSGTATTMTSTTESYTITRLATDEFTGSAATIMFLGTSTGYVYRSTDGSTWGSGKSATYSTSYSVVSMTAVPTGTTGTGRALLVGSSYNGYYEADVTSGLGSFTTGDSSNIVAAGSNYDSSLGNMPVMSFVYTGDETSGTLFACASAMAVDYTGLWSNKCTTPSSTVNWDGWASE